MVFHGVSGDLSVLGCPMNGPVRSAHDDAALDGLDKKLEILAEDGLPHIAQWRSKKGG